MGKLTDPFFGNIQPDETVNVVYNLSQGQDARGPWNEKPFDYKANPEPQGGFPPAPVNPDDEKATVKGAKLAKAA
jgi:Mn-containing catalase